MVKFSKELEAQLIPEWKEAFVNYWQLKKCVKKIKLSQKPKQPHHYNPVDAATFGCSILDPVRHLGHRIATRFRSSNEGITDIIQVRKKTTKDDGDGDGEDDEVYQTELLQLFSEDEKVKVFFETLDEELNKVNQFYRNKETEFTERGEALNKQLRILLDLKQLLHHRRCKTPSASLIPDSSTTPSFSSSPRNSDFSESAGDFMNEPPSETSESEDVTAATMDQLNPSIGVNQRPAKTKKKIPSLWNSSATTNVKKKMQTTEASTTAISAFTSMLWEDLVKYNPKKDGPRDLMINRKKVQCAEKMIRGAFVELYRGLGLLKNYSSLNVIAFTKILKKFDKVANQSASMSYMKVVKKSHFFTSDKVVRLMDEVESIFTRHFANNDRKKAMKYLRPRPHKGSHMITFFVGLFTGCFVTLFSIYAILAHLAGILSSSSQVDYMETVYPVFSIFALLSLHLFMYGCNLFMWKNTRINYTFIFEFSPNTALNYRDAFLLSTTLMTSVVSAMVVHLLLRANGFSPAQIDAIPGILLMLFFALLICPFNILYRPTRYCFIRIIRNIVASPFCKVLMVDFFMADQLTSQIPLLRHMESTACYFIAGNFKTHRYEICKSGRLYRQLAYVISFSPYYWRAMQCARRWFDEQDVNHLANMGKYVSAMVAAGARLTYATEPNLFWFCIVLITSVIATIYQLYWDFVKDWGFLDPKSKNPWLRDDLILKRKSIYYISIALNMVLRVAWVETVMRFRVGVFESRLLDFFLASLEVIRRGHWNFYRLENEHLNNVGKFRAVKTVPLPFREMDSDG